MLIAAGNVPYRYEDIGMVWATPLDLARAAPIPSALSASFAMRPPVSKKPSRSALQKASFASTINSATLSPGVVTGAKPASEVYASGTAIKQNKQSRCQMFRQFLVLISLAAMSGSSLAKGQLPFTGTRTFCGFDGSTAVVTIGSDGFTKVKTNMWTGITKDGKPDLRRHVAFSGKLDAKGTLRRSRDMYLEIKSGRDIEMWGPQDSMGGKLCKQR